VLCYVHIRHLQLTLYRFIEDLNVLTQCGLGEPGRVQMEAVLEPILREFATERRAPMILAEPILEFIGQCLVWNHAEEVVQPANARRNAVSRLRQIRRAMTRANGGHARPMSSSEREFFSWFFAQVVLLQDIVRPVPKPTIEKFSRKKRAYLRRNGRHRPDSGANPNTHQAFSETVRLAEQKLRRLGASQP
jgi:hypothetical protein